MQNIPEQIDLVLEGVGAIGKLYIGNYSAASNPKTLKKHNIRAVITAATGLMLSHPQQTLPNYLYLPVDDVLEQQLTPFFNPTYEFIQKNRPRTNVLIHCFSGISRSAALLIAYIIRKYGHTVVQAVNLCKKSKRRINPNKSFIRQLVKYHNERTNTATKRFKTETDLQPDKQTNALSDKLLMIKKNSENIEMKLREAKKKLIENEGSNSKKSEYLKSVLEKAKITRTQSHNVLSNSNNQYLSSNRLALKLSSIIQTEAE